MKLEVCKVEGGFDFSSSPYIVDYSLLEAVEYDFFRVSSNIRGNATIRIYTSIDGANYKPHSEHLVTDGQYDSALFHLFSRYLRVEIVGVGDYIYVALVFFSEKDSVSGGSAEGGGSAESEKQIEYDLYLNLPIHYAGGFAYYFLSPNNQVIAMLTKHTISNQLNLMLVYQGEGMLLSSGFSQSISASAPTLLSVSLPPDTNYIILQASSSGLMIYAIKVFYRI